MMTGWKSRIPALLKRERQEVDRIIREAAFEVEGLAKLAAPVDTGLLRASVYTVTSRSSNRAEADANAQQIAPGVDLGMEPTAQEMTAVVTVGAEYGIYVELGSEKMGARPYLGPALEQVSQRLGAELRRVF